MARAMDDDEEESEEIYSQMERLEKTALTASALTARRCPIGRAAIVMRLRSIIQMKGSWAWKLISFAAPAHTNQPPADAARARRAANTAASQLPGSAREPAEPPALGGDGDSLPPVPVESPPPASTVYVQSAEVLTWPFLLACAMRSFTVPDGGTV